MTAGPRPLDAAAWASIVPQLSVAALLRHLPAIAGADLDSATLDLIAGRLTDPRAVAASRVFPSAFWRAAKGPAGALFGPELDRALDLAAANAAAVPGRSLVILDASGSMREPVHRGDDVPAFEIGAVFAASLAAAARRDRGEVDLVLAGTSAVHQPVHPSVRQTVDEIGAVVGTLGHATDRWVHARQWFEGHDRVLVFTDEHDEPAAGGPEVARWRCPVYVWDLRGDGGRDLDAGRGRHVFAGFTDAAYWTLPLLEHRHAPAA